MTVTQQEEKKTLSGMKIKKVRNILLKIIGAIVLAIVLFLGIVYIANVMSSHSEQKRIVPYGQHVSVDGKNMNVLSSCLVMEQLLQGLILSFLSMNYLHFTKLLR